MKAINDRQLTVLSAPFYVFVGGSAGCHNKIFSQPVERRSFQLFQRGVLLLPKPLVLYQIIVTSSFTLTQQTGHVIYSLGYFICFFQHLLCCILVFFKGKCCFLVSTQTEQQHTSGVCIGLVTGYFQGGWWQLGQMLFLTSKPRVATSRQTVLAPLKPNINWVCEGFLLPMCRLFDCN